MKCPKCNKPMKKTWNKWRCTNPECPVTIISEVGKDDQKDKP